MNKPLYQALVSHLLNNVDDTTVFELHNEHAAVEDYVYTSIEEIADMIATDNPTKIASMVYFGNVPSWNARYFCLNRLGNIDGFNSPVDEFSPIDFKLLAERIIENDQFDAVDFDADRYSLSDNE